MLICIYCLLYALCAFNTTDFILITRYLLGNTGKYILRNSSIQKAGYRLRFESDTWSIQFRIFIIWVTNYYVCMYVCTYVCLCVCVCVCRERELIWVLFWKAVIKRSVFGWLFEKHTVKRNFGHQNRISSRIEENHEERWSSWPASETSVLLASPALNYEKSKDSLYMRSCLLKKILPMCHVDINAPFFGWVTNSCTCARE